MQFPQVSGGAVLPVAAATACQGRARGERPPEADSQTTDVSMCPRLSMLNLQSHCRQDLPLKAN